MSSSSSSRHTGPKRRKPLARTKVVRPHVGNHNPTRLHAHVVEASGLYMAHPSAKVAMNFFGALKLSTAVKTLRADAGSAA